MNEEIQYNKYNTLPEQVDENLENIKRLQNLIITSTTIPKGKWKPNQIYEPKDSVYLNSGFYICKKRISDSITTPDNDEEHWYSLYKNTYGQEIQVNTNNISNIRNRVDTAENEISSLDGRVHTAEDSITRIDDAIAKKYINCRVVNVDSTIELTFNARSAIYKHCVIFGIFGGSGVLDVKLGTDVSPTRGGGFNITKPRLLFATLTNTKKFLCIGEYEDTLNILKQKILTGATFSYQDNNIVKIEMPENLNGTIYIFNDPVNFDNKIMNAELDLMIEKYMLEYDQVDTKSIF